jgi:hypothetical protein
VGDLDLGRLVIALLPMVVLLLVLGFFIARALRFWRSYSSQMLRQVEALERIATALEKRQ